MELLTAKEERGSEKRGDEEKKASKNDPKIEGKGLNKSQPVRLLSRKLDEKPRITFDFE